MVWAIAFTFRATTEGTIMLNKQVEPPGPLITMKVVLVLRGGKTKKLLIWSAFWRTFTKMDCKSNQLRDSLFGFEYCRMEEPVLLLHFCIYLGKKVWYICTIIQFSPTSPQLLQDQSYNSGTRNRNDPYARILVLNTYARIPKGFM